VERPTKILGVNKAAHNKRFTVLPVIDILALTEEPAPNRHNSVLDIIESDKKSTAAPAISEILACSAEHQNLRPILKKRGNGVQVNIGECQTDITAVDNIRVSHLSFPQLIAFSILDIQ